MVSMLPRWFQIGSAPDFQAKSVGCHSRGEGRGSSCWLSQTRYSALQIRCTKHRRQINIRTGSWTNHLTTPSAGSWTWSHGLPNMDPHQSFQHQHWDKYNGQKTLKTSKKTDNVTISKKATTKLLTLRCLVLEISIFLDFFKPLQIKNSCIKSYWNSLLVLYK